VSRRPRLFRQAFAEAVGTASRPWITVIAVAEGPGDVAEKHDQYLDDGFGRD